MIARQVVSGAFQSGEDDLVAPGAPGPSGILEAGVSRDDGCVGETNTRMSQLMRQATLGALTSSLLHDLASTMQALSAALSEITQATEDQADSAGSPVSPELTAAVSDANSAADEAVQLFVQMRKFVRDGDVTVKAVRVDRMVDRIVHLAGGHVRERAQLRVGELPAMDMVVGESLFVQVLANLLRNAATASPKGGVVDLQVQVGVSEIAFTVTDDGPGVPPESVESQFDPCAGAPHQGTGLGLAISAYAIEMLGGTLRYRKDPERGACFTVTVPRTSATAAPPIGD